MPGVDLNYFIKQANKLTQKIEERKKELAEETVERASGDGLVTVVATGNRELKSIKIDPKAVDPSDVAMLEDLLVAARDDARLRAHRRACGRGGAERTNGRAPERPRLVCLRLTNG